MKLYDRTSLGYILTSAFGLYLMLFSLFSFITFTDYFTKGNVDHINFYIPCGPVFVIVFAIIICVLNSFNALLVYKNTKSKNILIISYIFLIYMSFIIILILAVFFEELHNLLIVAFPIFFIGAFLLPTCAYIVYAETLERIERRIPQIECFNCRYTFEIDPEEQEKDCPLCGALNKIPCQ